MKNIPKLAALGAAGAASGLGVFFLGLVWLTLPRFTGGINAATAAVTWISLGTVFVALIAVHLVYAAILWRAQSKG